MQLPRFRIILRLEKSAPDGIFVNAVFHPVLDHSLWRRLKQSAALFVKPESIFSQVVTQHIDTHVQLEIYSPENQMWDFRENL